MEKWNSRLSRRLSQGDMDSKEGAEIGSQLLPSRLPSSVTRFGSLSGESLADVREMPPSLVNPKDGVTSKPELPSSAPSKLRYLVNGSLSIASATPSNGGELSDDATIRSPGTVTSASAVKRWRDSNGSARSRQDGTQPVLRCVGWVATRKAPAAFATLKRCVCSKERTLDR